MAIKHNYTPEKVAKIRAEIKEASIDQLLGNMRHYVVLAYRDSTKMGSQIYHNALFGLVETQDEIKRRLDA